MSDNVDNPGQTAADDRPLPPVPEQLPSPALHAVRRAEDYVGFVETALETDDVVRTRQATLGNVHLLGHPDQFERVLLTERDKFCKTGDLEIMLGGGLVTASGDEWERQREVMQGPFAERGFEPFADAITRAINRRVDRWESGEIDLQAAFTQLLVDVEFASILGAELDPAGHDDLRERVDRLDHWYTPTCFYLPSWVPTPARRRARRAKESVRERIGELVTAAAADPPTPPTDADALLPLLVGLREAGMIDVTDERLRDRLFSMTFVGHDTTISLLTLTMYTLATHPSVAERFHAEVDAIDGRPTPEAVADMPVTERVLTETMRLYPPAYHLPRQTTEPVVFDGYRVPEGERVNLEVLGVHRDDRFYDDPEQFRPRRWTGDRRQTLHDFAYAPFGAGPRHCIGRQAAKLIAKLALVVIGRQFEATYLGATEDGHPVTSAEMALYLGPDRTFRLTDR